MTHFIEFKSAAGGSVLVEVDELEVATPPGIEKAGLRKRVGDAVATAEATFEDAVQGVVQRNLAALNAAIDALPRKPDEIELTFGLKATGEVGNVAIAKAGGEVNLSVRMLWKTAAKE